jgi:N-acetylglucosaminyldiphosphoundecaprenol N-acetyl-beta-D-mannosaminyltransferase
MLHPASSEQPTAFWSQQPGSHPAADREAPDDLARQIYCIIGLPIDAVEMTDVVQRIEGAAARTTPFLISTVNVNFLAISQTDSAFKDAILRSDLCIVDGMPVVWIARLMDLPIRRRVAGSDVFAAMKSQPFATNLKLFLFGGDEGVADAAARAINQRTASVQCVGSIYPGLGNLDEMSRTEIIDQINASGANFLVVSLGAQKGQHWLLRNHSRLQVPIRTNFGAVVNFEAGTVKRAPQRMAKLGLEWLWRIKEEPQLWRRYWHDGQVLLRLLLTRALPLALAARWQRLRLARSGQELHIDRAEEGTAVTLHLAGGAIAPYVATAISEFRAAVNSQKQLLIDLSATRCIDCRFFGLLLMLRKQLEGSGRHLVFTDVPSRIARLFRRNGVAFLLSHGWASDVSSICPAAAAPR